ncbi:MAG: ImmA/IrrE family metallo-endopeptidase [Caldisericum sp.]|uniref:ImmA/IrrE family metallo-endopeptidase n=1 Tax=Caldisericum sp. TaxID=2499687 RepID=UPI003D13D872
MKFTLENYLGNEPSLYARKVLRESGLKAAPICEKTVADYLGLELKEFSLNSSAQNPELLDIIKTACAWLQRRVNGKSRIWVHGDAYFERKRLSIFHECGHAILPWHEDFDYLCSDKDVDPTVRSRIERESFGCGSEFLMPRDMFVEDVLSLETSIYAIEQLRHRHVASMEPTAIRYAYITPGLCGIVMIKPAENQKPKPIVQDHTPPGQMVFPFRIPPKPLTIEDDKRYPLKVKYFVKSHRFPKYIAPGTGIEEGNSVFEAWASGRPLQDEIPASVFGSSAKWAYNAECIPLGKSGMVLVLLWLPDYQLKLDFKNAVIL